MPIFFILILVNLLYILQLFHFDVHEDVRTIADATVEKDEVCADL